MNMGYNRYINMIMFTYHNMQRRNKVNCNLICKIILNVTSKCRPVQVYCIWCFNSCPYQLTLAKVLSKIQCGLQFSQRLHSRIHLRVKMCQKQFVFTYKMEEVLGSTSYKQILFCLHEHLVGWLISQDIDTGECTMVWDFPIHHRAFRTLRPLPRKSQ